MANLFNLPAPLPIPNEPELFEELVKKDQVCIERIVSTGQITPENEWYEQKNDEWVVLLQGKAKLLYDHEKGETKTLQAGDYLLIPAMRKHRVVYTSTEPPCIWLAVHF
ncbi:MAG: cupin domain-containing protein [Chitinophagales bacterium]